MKKKKTARGSVILRNEDGTEVYATKVQAGYVVWKPRHMIHEEYKTLRKALKRARAVMDVDRKIL